jgi:hypothetical protein
MKAYIRINLVIPQAQAEWIYEHGGPKYVRALIEQAMVAGATSAPALVLEPKPPAQIEPIPEQVLPVRDLFEKGSQ